MIQVVKAHGSSDVPKYYWTDSTVVVLDAITYSVVKVYAANRVSIIQLGSSVNNWNHVATKEIPSDHAARGISPVELLTAAVCWYGPSWLSQKVFTGQNQ